MTALSAQTRAVRLKRFFLDHRELFKRGSAPLTLVGFALLPALDRISRSSSPFRLPPLSSRFVVMSTTPALNAHKKRHSEMTV
jgi:hypothetical protein